MESNRISCNLYTCRSNSSNEHLRGRKWGDGKPSFNIIIREHVTKHPTQRIISSIEREKTRLMNVPLLLFIDLKLCPILPAAMFWPQIDILAASSPLFVMATLETKESNSGEPEIQHWIKFRFGFHSLL